MSSVMDLSVTTVLSYSQLVFSCTGQSEKALHKLSKFIHHSKKSVTSVVLGKGHSRTIVPHFS